jgi:endonuclease III
MINPKNLTKIIPLLKKQSKQFENPIASELGERTKDPFLVLISCIMSLRTKDTTTGPAATRLFSLADNPKDMLKLSRKEIENAIFPVGFYITKARYIQNTCKSLVKDYESKVPENESDLLKLPGIGRKCMGIVMNYGHGKNTHIPVDTHVHKIANRLGWVKTKTPEKTEISLTKIVPKKYWHDLNDLLVRHGQNICVPVSPHCSKCLLSEYCPRIGVKSSR